MKIAIPTYNRPACVSYELAKSIVGEDNVYVFFHNVEDASQYKINIKNKIITNTPRGAAIAKNSILNFFKAGEEIVLMDDDVTSVSKLSFDSKKLIKLKPFEILKEFEKCFEICKKNNCFLWGIYPVENYFFMKHKISNKCLLVGHILGVIINDLRFDENLPVKNDYDYALQNIVKYKKVARFDFLTCDGKVNSKGGLDYIYKSKDLYEKDFNKFMEKWSGYSGFKLKINPKRKNEVLLI